MLNIAGNNFMNDAQAISMVTGQMYRVNTTVLEAVYPDWNVGELVFVDQTGPEWSPGVWTWTSDITGAMKYQSGAAKDVPLADVSQDYQLKTFHLSALGYQWNIEEINTILGFAGGSLPDRRARAAVMGSRKFLYDLAFSGQAEKGVFGMTNYTGVTADQPAADGTGSARAWVALDGTGLKTPAQIVRDFNIEMQAIADATYNASLPDTVLLPQRALTYIASTPYSSTTMDTILTFLQRTNIYTQATGRPLVIKGFRELNTAATSTSPSTQTGNGRAVFYRNDQNRVKLHLPMPFRFLPIHQDGPFNFVVPGIMRSGGVEILDLTAFRYLDGVSLSS